MVLTSAYKSLCMTVIVPEGLFAEYHYISAALG